MSNLDEPNPLAFDSADRPHIAYRDGCILRVRLATPWGDAVVRRGVVADLTSGWKPSSLPLSFVNDDRTVPYPLETTIPGAATDVGPPDVPLVLYRVFWENGRPGYNTLLAVKGASGVELVY